MHDTIIRSGRMVGRQGQVESLDRVILETQARQASVVLVTGEAGIGKTRLAQEVEARAKKNGFITLWAHCFESDQCVPYAPLLDLFDSWLHSAPDPASFLAPLASILIRWIPSLAAIFPDTLSAAALDPEQERHRLFRAITDFFVRLAEIQPVFILVEDLHWSDETSLAFWLHLIHHASSYPLLLVLTYRSEQISPSLQYFLAELDRQRVVREFPLNRLTRAEVEQMTRDILAEPRPLPGSLYEPIFRLSEGNPLLVEEILKVLLSSDDLAYVNGRWSLKPLVEVRIPRTVQNAVQRRVSSLSESGRRVLSLAAIAGQRFDFRLLKELTGLGEQELLNIVAELIEAHLIIEKSADQFAFRHALTRQAIYSEMLVRERNAWHLAMAEAIERRVFVSQIDSLDARVGDLAYHFYEARVWEKALHYGQQAGEKARSMYASREAIEQFTRALEAAQNIIQPSLFDIPANEEDVGLVEAKRALGKLHRARGQMHEIRGNFKAARADYEKGLKAAITSRDRQAEWQSLLNLGFLFASRDYKKSGDYLQRALELARARNDPATIGHSLNRVGNWHMNLDEVEQALDCRREALGIFEHLNDPAGMAETLDLLATTSCARGDLIEGSIHYERAIALFREQDDRRGLVSALASISERGGMWANESLVAATSTLAESQLEADQALALAREIGWRSGEAYALVQVAMSAGALGEYARALDLAHQALAVAQEIDHRQWTGYAQAALGTLYHDLLFWPIAQEHLEQGLEYARTVGSVHLRRVVIGYLANTYLQQRKFDRAKSLLDETLRADVAPNTMLRRVCWLARADLALAQGDPKQALPITDKLIAATPNLAKRSSYVIPRLWQLRGECLSAMRRLDEAETVLQAARRETELRAARPRLWRILAALGQVYKLQRRREQAEAVIDSAHALIEQLAAGISNADVRENFLRRAKASIPVLSRPSGLQAAKKEFGGLTAREREVAALIAEGKTNAEIARQLVVSQRTVESHVTHILQKLDFSTRVQIAAWASGKNLTSKSSS